MKCIFKSWSVALLLVVALSGFSWAQCPEDTVDLGVCDTLNVIPWTETDTCFISCYMGNCDTVCINNPGEEFPCFLFVHLLVTHDSNTIAGSTPPNQDSIAAFVIPLTFWHQSTGGADSLIFPFGGAGYQGINNPDMNQYFPWMEKSMFRHFIDRQADDTTYNRMLKMVEAGKTAWTVYTDVDSVAAPGDSGHVFLGMPVMSATSQRWWEGDRTLLATLTFRVPDTMHVCIDSIFWPPGSNFSFTRNDAKIYVPRHNLPMCIWVGPPQPEVVTVTSPNGGENWCAGSNQSITWTATGVTDVKIEYSTNGGADWDTIVSSTPNDGDYSWNIPSDLSTSTACRVKISDLDDDPSDISDANFTITGKYVEIISPNGGENWIVDSTYYITWIDSCVENVSIEYSVNGGADWDTIVSSTPSDGSHSWQIPDSPSDSCLVRICDLDGAACDASDGNFSIVRPDFTIQTEPETLTVVAGEFTDCDVILNSLYGFSSPCTLTVEEDSLPANTTYDLDLATVVPTDTSVLTFHTDVSTPPGTSTVIVTGSEMSGGKNGIEHSTQVVLIVTPPSPDFTIQTEPETLTVVAGESIGCNVILNSLYGFSSPCTLTVEEDSLPANTTYDFNPATVVPTDTSILTFYTDASTPPGTSTIIVTGSEMSGEKAGIEHSAQVVLIVTPGADFAIDVLPDTLWIPQGYSEDYKIILTSINGFASPCTLTVAGHPDGSTPTFDPFVLVPTDSSILTIAIPDTTSTGTFTLTITATEMEKSKGIAHSKDVTLIVVLASWNFEVDAFPETLTVHPGDDTIYNVIIVPQQQFNSPCTLCVYNLPPGATAAFDDSVIGYPYTDTSHLSIATADTTPEAVYPITIEARCHRWTRYDEVMLIVQTQTDVEDEGDQLIAPDRFALFQNQPNPFNPETKISYYLPEGCEVELTIYNILGRRVKTLFEGYQNAGMKTLVWDGRDEQGKQSGSGIYFYRLQAREFNQTRKMTLIK